MGSFKDGLVDGLRTAACTLVGGQPEVLSRWLDYTTPSGLLPLANAVRQWVCGTDPDDDVPIPPPPFTGGQCSVPYRVQTGATVILPPNDPFFATSGITVVPGPISGVEVVSDSSGCSGSASGPSVIVRHAGGCTVFQNNGPTGSFSGAGIVLLERVDGLPDDCGDPPPDLPPPGPVSIDVDVTYGPTNNFTVTVPVIFGVAYVSLDGRVNIPVNVQLNPEFALNGTLEIFPDFELDLDFNIGGNPNDEQPGDDTPPDNPDQNPGDETDEPEGDDDGPTPPIFAVLTAAAIESDARPSTIVSFVGPDIFAPRLGSVRFGTVLEGQIFWSEDIDIKGLRQVTPCPFPWGATTAVVTPAQGVGINWVPIRTARPEWPETLILGSQVTVDNRTP